jgi:hypothetical protein
MYLCQIVLALIVILYILKQTPIKHDPRTVYLFITGGYDSIFRLCQVAMSRTPIQGIYLNLPNVDGTSGHRRNTKFEMGSIINAVKELRKMGYGQYIYPTQIITSVKLSPKVRNVCYNFYKTGLWSRPVTQYVYMMEISLQMNKIIETGVLCDPNAAIHATIGKYINPKTQMVDLEKIKRGGDLDLIIFRNLRFPLCGTSKQSMLTYAQNNGFAHILRKTISCWYPDNRGNPCGKCEMCRERIKI